MSDKAVPGYGSLSSFKAIWIATVRKRYHRNRKKYVAMKQHVIRDGLLVHAVTPHEKAELGEYYRLKALVVQDANFLSSLMSGNG